MSFETQEESIAKGRPVYLLHFRYGDPEAAFVAYTTNDYPILFDGVTYGPAAISVPDRQSSGDLDRTTLEISVSRLLEIAERFRVSPPSFVVGLIIRQGHANGTEFPVVWVGRVLGSTREGGEVRLIAEPSSTGLRRLGLRRHYQYSCPHALYGPQCKASLSLATISVPTVNVEPGVVVLPAGWDTDERVPKYLGGLVRWETDDGDVIRSIVGIEGTTRLLLNGPTINLGISQVVRVSLGCSRTFEIVDGQPVSDCQDLHGNIHNFGGQPFIPLKNPIGTRLNIYY